MKTSTTISESKAYPLAQTQLQNKFNLNGQDIIPVETSSYHTIDFRDPNNANSIMYSTSISACAIVLIKNFNEETGKYDNIVTMGHFYPANAYRDSKAIENLEKIMQDFEERGGVFSSKTSVILAGGGLLPGENIKDTTPLGPLLDAVKLLKYALSMEEEVVSNYAYRIARDIDLLDEPEKRWMEIFYEEQIENSRKDVDNLKMILRGL